MKGTEFQNKPGVPGQGSLGTGAENAITTEILKKGVNIEKLAERAAGQPELLQAAFDGLGADKARIKYGCLKLLRIISERSPGVLYPEIARFFRLLDSESNIFQWGAIIIVGNLAAVDSEGKIDAILNRYLRPVSGHVLITAANVIGAAGKIALARPHLAERIARALLQVETANYQTEECRNVAAGHAIESFDLFFKHLKKPRPVVEFVERQLNNPRNAVKNKAARFLKKHAPEPAPDTYAKCQGAFPRSEARRNENQRRLVLKFRARLTPSR
jgi:hypothetical protein